MKIGVIGTGQFARSFITLWQLHPDVEAVHVCDLVPERAAEHVERYGLAGADPQVIGEQHDLVADPMFANPGVDPTQSSFHLSAGSRAIGTGTTHLAPKVDIDGHTRPPGQGIDRGAYRYSPQHS